MAISQHPEHPRATPFPVWIRHKIDDAKTSGFGFCLVYATPQAHDDLVKDLQRSSLAEEGVSVFPALGTDRLRLEQGNPQTMPILIRWPRP